MRAIKVVKFIKAKALNEKGGGMELNETHQLLVYDDNLMGKKHKYSKGKYTSSIRCQ
jgi:hypothetical protein